MRSSGGLISQYLRNVLGTYSPTSDGVSGIDFEYIISGILLIMTVYFIFKLFIYVFKHG